MPIRRSGIEYADFSSGDASFIIGCTPVNPGCINCYARELIQNRQGRDDVLDGHKWKQFQRVED